MGNVLADFWGKFKGVQVQKCAGLEEKVAI